tara:strand:- start:6762 stop:7118 length:357 start_codon:yes stop_codon:yes gene_type:complete
MIRPPAWCAGAVPEKNRGWVDPNSGELLVSSRFTQAQIDEFHGVPSIAEVQAIHEQQMQNQVIDEWQAEDLNEDGVVDELESMTKKQLEELGRENGVELDRRKNRSTLVNQMRNLLSK